MKLYSSFKMKMKFIKKKKINKYAPQKRTFAFLTKFDIEYPISFMHSYIDSFAIVAEHIISRFGNIFFDFGFLYTES